MLGGEHTASLGGFRGLKRVHPDAVILQADAHLDMRPDYDGQAFTHATWLNHVGQEFGFAIIHQVGLRSGDRQEWVTARRDTAWSSTELTPAADVRQRIGQRPVYVSIDIDVLDPAHAPGTGCPEPGGVTFRELAAFLYGLEGLRVVGTRRHGSLAEPRRGQHHGRRGGQAGARSDPAVRRLSRPWRPAAALILPTISSSALR